jgi:NTP pyrophosphatase (non-canonical NTP hydrolase)
MSEGGQQQPQQQQQQPQQQQQGQQQQQQQQQDPMQLMGRALANIRRVQNLLELNYPNQTDAIQMQREAGDVLWAVIQSMQQQDRQGG